MKETHADEGWRTNYWHRCHFLAQIRNNQNLDWFYRLLNKIKHASPGEKEYKSNVAIYKLNALDTDNQKIIWNSLQEVMIVIVEPKQFIKELGVEITQDYSYVLQLKGERFTIKSADRDIYNYYDDLIKNTVSNLVLASSPVMSVGYSFSQLPILPRRDDFFSPENLLSMISDKDSKKKVIGAIKLTSRLFVAFFEVIDPSTRKRIVAEMLEYGPLWEASPFHSALLKEALSSDRYFDAGDTQSVEIIKRCVKEIESSLKYIYEEDTLPSPKIAEVDSEQSPYVQAADWATGIARDIYEKGGIDSVKQKFKYVIYNGETLFD
jgi:hypothetical protein